MKFACDRCGKRYASAETPLPGRAYRVRCRCGHEIVIRGTDAVTAPSDAPVAEAAPLDAPPLLDAPPPLDALPALAVPPQLPVETPSAVRESFPAVPALTAPAAAPPVPETSGSHRIPGTIPVPRGQLNLGTESSTGTSVGLIVASVLIASALVGGVVVLRNASGPSGPARQAPAATSAAAPAPQPAPATPPAVAPSQPAPQTARAPGAHP